jgi:hypothetical protein
MSQTYSQPAPATSLTRAVLLAAWAVLSLAALAFVLNFGSNVPTVDEWEFVPVLTGHEPVGPWIWAQHNEHRLPLPRAVFVGLIGITRDFRSGMVLQVALLSVLSLWLTRTAAELRGRPVWADVFFPISLLHLGHWENYLLGYQICFVLFTVFAAALGVVAVRATRDTAFRSGVQAGCLVLVLALCGGSGLVLIPPVVVWLLYLAAVARRIGPRWHAAVVAGLAGLAVIYLGVYALTYLSPSNHPPPSGDPVAVLVVAGEVLAMAPGIGLAGAWPAVAVAMLLLGAATLGLVARDLRAPERRPSAVGLIAVAAGLGGLALAVGVGRAAFGDTMGLWARYALLTWPLLGIAYLAWVRQGGWGGKWVPIGLCVAAALAFPPNNLTGLIRGNDRHTTLAAVVVKVRAGAPPEVVAAGFKNTADAGQEGRAILGIPMLKEARLSALAGPDAAPEPWRIAAVVAGAVVLGLAGRWVFHLGRAVQVERARELFRLQHERFEQMLLVAAAETGKPRGLTWAGCEITGDAVLARDRQTRGIVAFVPVVIRFEPVAGSEMEDVPAAREPRPATAVFAFVRGHWRTDGRVVFNHTPEQAAAVFGGQFAVLGQHH